MRGAGDRLLCGRAQVPGPVLRANCRGEGHRRRRGKMIEVRNLSLTLGKKEILKQISLKLEDGHIYGLVGNNGCGKTMLMRCICGFIRPTCGEVLVDGKQVGVDVDYLPDAGVILETPGFIPYYSGCRNLKALADIRGLAGREEIRDTLTLVGLDPDLKLPVRKYSLGMRQRLGIAQAIMEQQKTLILDEPMNGLDKHGVQDVRELLLKLKGEGRLILLASHNSEDIRILCDEIYEMEMGALCR